ncbi:MAG TPA: hypothetical protein VGG99_23750 [Acetobacteraceae bacterium]
MEGHNFQKLRPHILPLRLAGDVVARPDHYTRILFVAVGQEIHEIVNLLLLEKVKKLRGLLWLSSCPWSFAAPIHD